MFGLRIELVAPFVIRVVLAFWQDGGMYFVELQCSWMKHIGATLTPDRIA